MALDIDHWDMAVAYLGERGIDLPTLFNALDSVQIDSGNTGHGKLLYKLTTPLPSKKIIINGITVLELRCATANGLTVQDVLPPSRHPSGSTYRWAGRGDWDKLPELPDSLLKLWNELLAVKEYTPTEFSTDHGEILSALASIDPSCDHDTWLSIGMALHSAGLPVDVWESWSSKSEKFKAGECVSRWDSFKGEGVNIGTLYHHAFASGWSKPLPEGMFKAVEVSPDKVLKRLERNIDPPTVDLSLWPAVLANRAAEIATEVGCDPVVPLMAGLAAVCGAADKRTKLKITDSWSVPPLLWLMTVGSPSDKKSPGSRPMFSTLKQLERDQIDSYQAEMLIWKGKEAKTAAQLKAYRDWAASPEADLPNGVPPAYAECPPEPKQLRLLVSDSTSQKIVHMAVGRDRGFLLYLDEMHHWLHKLNDNRGGEDRGCWIQGYESGSYAMDRVGAGSIRADNLAVGVYGNCQPAVFKQQMVQASVDGLIQRFIPVVLNSDCTTDWADSLPEFMSSGNDYDAMIRQVFAIKEQTVTCSEGAIKQFRQFSGWYHTGRKLDLILNSSEAYMTAVGKIEGTCARLALLLHLMEYPHHTEMSEDCMRKTVDIMKQFIVPSLRYCFMEVAGLKDPLDAWVVDYVIQLASTKPSVSIGEIKRAARRQLENREGFRADNAIISIMDELQSHGYVKLDESKGRVPHWYINPALADLYKDKREAIINAKQMVIEQFRDGARTKGIPRAKNADAIGFI
jgi:hypothetical protein